MKMSTAPLLSAPPPRRLLAADSNTTNRPSALIPGLKLPALAWVPSVATLTRSVWPEPRSRTKTSVTPLLSPATRFEESDSKATTLPSPDTAGGAVGAEAKPDASPPAAGTLTRVMDDGPLAPPTWARKMSVEPLKSSPTRLSAADSNVTQCPSGLTEGLAAPPLACLPLPISWLMRVGLPVAPTQTWSVLIGRSLYFDDDWKASPFPVASSDGSTAAFCLLA